MVGVCASYYVTHSPTRQSFSSISDLDIHIYRKHKNFVGNKFRGRGTYTYRWDIRWKNFCALHPTRKYLYQHIYYIILPIYVESFSWQYTAVLHGSYIVDIVLHARLLRRHCSVSVDHWQWQVKTQLRGSASEDTTAWQWRVTRLRGSGEWRHDCTVFFIRKLATAVSFSALLFLDCSSR